MSLQEFSGGIIPAYAGSTWPRSPRHRRTRDHPRVCGEHWRGGWPAAGQGGSSPRMRGALEPVHIGGGVQRIIPAYAGSTGVVGPTPLVLEDHPRVCGEHGFKIPDPGSDEGSSPRMRGAPDGDRRHVWLAGIIPAYAGSTSSRTVPLTICGDHPRVCGEHLTYNWNSPFERGSSPRMRGALSH